MTRTKTILRRIGWTLIAGGLLVLAFLGYQLFITDLLNGRIQAEARAELDDELAERRAELPGPTVVEVPVEADEPTEDDPVVRAPTATLVPEEAGDEGTTLGRLAIPEIGIDEVMFQGVTVDTLKKGPGHMPGTPVPGQPGNAVVSGHRTTYGRPFFDLDQLEEGDTIEVETATGEHVYEVRRSIVVEPTDVWVTGPMTGAWLTLTTCHPQFSAAQRLVVQAQLVEGPNLEYAQLLLEQERRGAA